MRTRWLAAALSLAAWALHYTGQLMSELKSHRCGREKSQQKSLRKSEGAGFSGFSWLGWRIPASTGDGRSAVGQRWASASVYGFLTVEAP